MLVQEKAGAIRGAGSDIEEGYCKGAMSCLMLSWDS